MSEDNQIVTPRSFIDLHVPPGRSRPVESREHIAARHEFCEDLAQMLAERARSLTFELGITPEDVLARIGDGLTADGSAVSAAEAGWVMGRLAEVLEWTAAPGAPATPD